MCSSTKGETEVQNSQNDSSKLSPSLSSQFRELGFLKLPGLLSSEEVSLLRRAMAKALRTFHGSPNSYNVTAAADSIWNDHAVEDQGSTQHDVAALAAAIRASDLPRLV